MERRDVLRSATLLVTAGTAGLAGCSGDDSEAEPTPSGGSAACDPPEGPLADALPDTDDYERQGDVTASDGSHDHGVERTAYALYLAQDGTEYYCSVTEFSSATAASEGTEQTRAESDHSTATLGLVQFGRYVYFAAGPDGDHVRAVLAATSLSEDCLTESLQILSETATSESS